MKKIYIDIDGVLIGKPDKGSINTCIAPYAEEFLNFCLKNFDCYWLSTHSRHGELESVLRVFQTYENNNLLELIKRIKPVKWNVFKTETIDLSSDFYWVDDQPMQSEINILKENNCLDRWIEVNTRKNPNGLLKVIDVLQNEMSRR